MKKATSYFTRNLPKSQKSTVNLCLKLIAFGMTSTLLTFEEKYFEYGEKGIRTTGLETVGYKSAFLADLVASQLFKNATINSRKSYIKGYIDTMDC